MIGVSWWRKFVVALQIDRAEGLGFNPLSRHKVSGLKIVAPSLDPTPNLPRNNVYTGKYRRYRNNNA